MANLENCGEEPFCARSRINPGEKSREVAESLDSSGGLTAISITILSLVGYIYQTGRLVETC